MATPHEPGARMPRPRRWFRGIRIRDVMIAIGPLVLVAAAAVGAAYWLVRPAPPSTLAIASGPDGSIFQATAERYRDILARNGVTLRILPSAGSLDNLHQLLSPASPAEIGFVQGGLAKGDATQKLVSLGAMFQEPLAVFYRGKLLRQGIAGLKGKRIAIGPEGSGTRALALTLLQANGITPGDRTEMEAAEGEVAAQALLAKKIDAAFLMGDSANPPTMRRLLRTPGIRLLSITEADAYVLRFPYLRKFDFPEGVFDLGRHLPRRTVHLIGPTVQLVARPGLHPALSDLLLEAAKEIHGRATLIQHAGEFPSPQVHAFSLSSDARRYYNSGKRFFYRWLPFWLATLADRLLVVVVPVIILLIPAFKLVPTLYQWRIRSRIYRWYGILIGLERRLMAQPDPSAREAMLQRLDEVERAVNQMKVPLSFADQLYVLRDHILFVRDRYAVPAEQTATASPTPGEVRPAA